MADEIAKPKRVIIFSVSWLPAQVDGVAVRMMAQVKELVNRGTEVLIITPDYAIKRGEDGKPMNKKQPLQEIPGTKHITTKTAFLPVYDRLMCQKVCFANLRIWLDAIESFKPDYVHATQDLGVTVIALACVMKRVPLIVSVHTDNDAIARRDPNFSWMGDNIFGRAHKWICCFWAWVGWLTWSASMNQYLTVSEHAKTILRGCLVRESQIYKEPWGPMVDREVFRIDQPADKVKATRERLTFGIPDAYLMVYVGRVNAEKDVLFLVEALERAPKNVVLALIGNGSLCAQLKPKHGKEHRLHCTGDFIGREEVALCLRAADLCVSASTMETVGFTAMESISCGTPMLAANAQGFAEHLSYDVNARLWTPEDKAHFDKELEFMMKTASKREGNWSRENLRKSMEVASLVQCTDRALRCYHAAKPHDMHAFRLFVCLFTFIFQVTFAPLVR